MWEADHQPARPHPARSRRRWRPPLSGIGVHTPVKQPAGDQVLDVDNRTYNALLRGLRCLGERGFAVLTGRWREVHPG